MDVVESAEFSQVGDILIWHLFMSLKFNYHFTPFIPLQVPDCTSKIEYSFNVCHYLVFIMNVG